MALSIVIKDKDDIYFASDSSRLSISLLDNDVSCLVLDQLLVQDIKAKGNKNRIVIYSHLMNSKLNVLKYALDSVLSKGVELTAEYVTNVVVPHIFKSLKKYRMLGENDSGFKTLNGDILIIGDDKIFDIDSLGYVLEKDMALEQNNNYVRFLTLSQKGCGAEEAIMKTIETSSRSIYPDAAYPIITGSLKSKKFKVIFGTGNESLVWRSKFRCQ